MQPRFIRKAPNMKKFQLKMSHLQSKHTTSGTKCASNCLTCKKDTKQTNASTKNTKMMGVHLIKEKLPKEQNPKSKQWMKMEIASVKHPHQTVFTILKNHRKKLKNLELFKGSDGSTIVLTTQATELKLQTPAPWIPSLLLCMLSTRQKL